ncbi:MAG: selenocysteine-specific translation elongation factor [Rhizobiales bacterium 62-17]|nr:MAG: selenocysteine-specific translation elongation factor [Rhizobiales bacterium 62-17]
MIVGTAGHIDHGKTSLVQALTGVDTDRLKEEKKRGISIDLGFAYLPAPDGSIVGFIDVPGHEAFVRNMLAGATGIDLALLVVAADDGVMPQTREHLMIVDLLGIRHGIVALTKADLLAPEDRGRVIAEIHQALSGTALAQAEIIPVSVVSGEGVDELRTRLFDWQTRLKRQADDGRFRLAVDRCFVLQGAGTVVTGTVLSGQVAVGDHVTISPSGLSARVRSIHAQNQPRERGLAGERCALNLAGEGVAKDAIRRGDVVLDPHLHAPTDRIDAKVRLLAGESKPLAQWMPVRLHHAAVEVGARIVLLDDEPVQPGTEAFVQLVLEHPIAAAVGDRFVLRDTTGQRTIGGGTLLDLRAPARKRRTPERLGQIEALALGEPAGVLAALLARSPFSVDLTAFARDHALNAPAMDALIDRQGVLRIRAQNAELGLSPATWLKLKRDLLATLESFHTDNPDLPGIGLERLRLQLLPRLPAPTFLSFLQGLAKGGEVGLQGAWVRLPGHEVRLTSADEQVWSKIRPMIADAERFRPPRVRDIAGIIGLHENDIRRLFKLLGRMGLVDEVAHDHFFLRGTVAEMVDIAVDVASQAPKGEFSAAQLRDRLDNGRKVAIQILEFFDRHGVTLRRGDLRRMNRHRVDLFRSSNDRPTDGREAFPVGRPDFKSGRGRETVLGGFDSLSLPPSSRSAL